MEDILIVKSKTNLSTLKNSSEIFYQENKDYDSDGEAIDSYDATKQFIIGTRQNLTPHWDVRKNEWSFHGGLSALVEIAQRLQLRDDNNNLLMPTEYSFKNIADPFFAHKSLWMGEYMEEGSKVLKSGDALQEFHMRVLKGRDDLENDGREERVSAFLTGKSNLHISSPKDEITKKSKKIEEETQAWTQYIELIKDPEKLRRVAVILDLRDTTDITAMSVELRDNFVTTENTVVRFGTTARKYFLHVCDLDITGLEVTSKMMAATRAQIIRRDTLHGYSFQGEKLKEGTIRNDRDLAEFFKHNDNIDLYLKLERLLEEKGKLIK